MGCMVLSRTFHTAPEQGHGLTPIVLHFSGPGPCPGTVHSQCDYTLHWNLIVCSSDIIRQSGSATGSMEMTFQLKKCKKDEKRQQLNQDHHRERRKIRRSAGSLKPEHRKGTSKFWMGKRVYWPPRDIITLHINNKLCECLLRTIPWEVHRSMKSFNLVASKLCEFDHFTQLTDFIDHRWFLSYVNDLFYVRVKNQ